MVLLPQVGFRLQTRVPVKHESEARRDGSLRERSSFVSDPVTYTFSFRAAIQHLLRDHDHSATMTTGSIMVILILAIVSSSLAS